MLQRILDARQVDHPRASLVRLGAIARGQLQRVERGARVAIGIGGQRVQRVIVVMIQRSAPRPRSASASARRSSELDILVARARAA